MKLCFVWTDEEVRLARSLGATIVVGADRFIGFQFLVYGGDATTAIYQTFRWQGEAVISNWCSRFFIGDMTRIELLEFLRKLFPDLEVGSIDRATGAYKPERFPSRRRRMQVA